MPQTQLHGDPLSISNSIAESDGERDDSANRAENSRR